MGIAIIMVAHSSTSANSQVEPRSPGPKQAASRDPGYPRTPNHARHGRHERNENSRPISSRDPRPQQGIGKMNTESVRTSSESQPTQLRVVDSGPNTDNDSDGNQNGKRPRSRTESIEEGHGSKHSKSKTSKLRRYDLEADVAMLLQIIRHRPHAAEYGTRSATWEHIAAGVDSAIGVENDKPFSARGCQDRFHLLLKVYQDFGTFGKDTLVGTGEGDHRTPDERIPLMKTIVDQMNSNRLEKRKKSKHGSRESPKDSSQQFHIDGSPLITKRKSGTDIELLNSVKDYSNGKNNGQRMLDEHLIAEKRRKNEVLQDRLSFEKNKQAETQHFYQAEFNLRKTHSEQQITLLKRQNELLGRIADSVEELTKIRKDLKPM